MNNLPPGVSAGDIPGNRSEDIAFQKDEEGLEKRLIGTVQVFLAGYSRILHRDKVDLDEEMQMIVDSVNWKRVTEKAVERGMERTKMPEYPKPEEVEDETTEE